MVETGAGGTWSKRMDAKAIQTSDAHRRRDRDAEVVAAAGRLAGLGDEIGAVHVVIGRRPTYAELRAARHDAERWGLRVSVSADGTVAMRRRATAAAPDPPAGSPPRRPWVDQRVPAGARRLVGSVRAWDAGFAGVREGTR